MCEHSVHIFVLFVYVVHFVYAHRRSHDKRNITCVKTHMLSLCRRLCVFTDCMFLCFLGTLFIFFVLFDYVFYDYKSDKMQLSTCTTTKTEGGKRRRGRGRGEERGLHTEVERTTY